MFKILKGDNLEIMRSFEDETFDMIFADPPYNMQTEGVLKRTDGSDFKGVDDDWDKFSSLDAYRKYSREWLKECKRILKDHGTIWVIGSFQNIYMLGDIIQDLDFWILNDVIWEKTNPAPNFTGSRFNNAHETLIWFKKNNNSKFTFNYQTMKYLNGGKQERSIWKIPLSTGKERLLDDDGNKLHNTQKPIELLERVILSSTKKGDLVLDPFSGTATTGVAALMYEREYIGIERDGRYCKYSKRRLEKQGASDKSLLIENVLDIKPPLVPMDKLIEKGYLSIGDVLVDSLGNNPVILKENGHVDVLEETLSIHKASARILGKPNHNGWDYWYKKDGMVSINDLRTKYRNHELNFTEEKLDDFVDGVRIKKKGE